MARQHHDNDITQSHGDFTDEPCTESSPLSLLASGSVCGCSVIAALACSWCALDYWNRQITSDLFHLDQIKMMDLDQDGIPEVVSPFQKFNYPLTLTFLQFAFMGVLFLSLYFSLYREHTSQLRHLGLTSDKRWPALVATHVFSTFFLQSLMMPAQMLSISLFAASHAAEIPILAALRTQVLGSRDGKKSLATVGLAFFSACTMFFAYGQIAGCACLWSGNGVAISGMAFWIVYLLLLAMPGANAVYQEGLLSQPGVHPMLLLAVQNLLACLLFGPILLLCHLTGWEDVSAAFVMFLTYNEVVLMVLWLCAQVAASSVLGIGLVYVIDSFWAITLRSLRVAFWSAVLLISFYTSNKDLPVSVIAMYPRMALWSLMLICSFLLGAAAVFADRLPATENEVQKRPPVTTSSRSQPSTNPFTIAGSAVESW